MSVAIITGAVLSLSGCEVNQINWGNRTYTVSGNCVHDATVTLQNGTALTPDGLTVHLQQVHLGGDVNGDGIADAVLFFACSNGVANGSEIQVFSRNAKPLARLAPPYFYQQPLGTFDPNNIKITSGTLYTGTEYADGVYAVFRWNWDGRAFHPVYSSGHHN